MEEQKVRLPISEEELQEFIAGLIVQFGLPDHDDTYDAVCTMIMHLPHTMAEVQPSYFAHGVFKAMANRAAFEKLQALKKKREAEELQKEQVKAGLQLVGEAVNEQIPVQDA